MHQKCINVGCAGQGRSGPVVNVHVGMRACGVGGPTGWWACLRADGQMGSFCAAHTLRDHSMTFLLEKQFLFRRPQSKLNDVICFLCSSMHNGITSHLIKNCIFQIHLSFYDMVRISTRSWIGTLKWGKPKTQIPSKLWWKILISHYNMIWYIFPYAVLK